MVYIKPTLYGLSLSYLKLVFSYFNNRDHRTKIKECFSNRLKIECSVLQGSVLGSLLFNINSSDMFNECEDFDIENYAVDTTPCVCASNINTVISELQIIASKLFTSFDNNHIKPTTKIATFPFFKFKNFEKSFFGGVLVESSSTEKLLRIQIDSDLTFDEYISSICNKVALLIYVI